MSDSPIARDDLRVLSASSEASLTRRPLDGAALLRIAYVEVALTGGLTTKANGAIERSYQVEPIGSEITLWRLGFVFDNWSSATAEVKTLALGELTAGYPRRSWTMDALAQTVRDPKGRMVSVLVTRRLRRDMEAATVR